MTTGVSDIVLIKIQSLCKQAEVNGKQVFQFTIYCSQFTMLKSIEKTPFWQGFIRIYRVFLPHDIYNSSSDLMLANLVI
jgi:hypothetical protein